MKLRPMDRARSLATEFITLAGIEFFKPGSKHLSICWMLR